MKVLTWNIACLPKPWNSFGSKNPSNRKQGILEYILGTDSDIICLQEVFDKSVRNFLTTNLTKKGYHTVTSSGGSGSIGCLLDLITCFGCFGCLSCSFNGGLLIAVKNSYTITSCDFTPFRASTGEDALANKGVLYARVKSLDTSRNSQVQPDFMDIFNTHLQADAKYCCPVKPQSDIRIEQVKEVKEIMRDRHSGSTAILAGDFNIKSNFSFNQNEDAVTYEYSVLESEMQSVYKYGHFPVNTDRPTSSWNAKIDYIFYFPKQYMEADIYTQIDTNTSLSDHYALSEHYTLDLLD